ncbi:hypothetical protein [Mesorhizobium sp. J428]|uniref:hypothetical protein n=1 Tax=Mesorhizobium sp. J428 TaxID=2898440 RepID=UPI002150EC74|nr:hypothetical protein [Mesorhizobium sp. J428]MCR5855614.1 hypothetical protein [Mesorhizobium sp. J428]
MAEICPAREGTLLMRLLAAWRRRRDDAVRRRTVEHLVARGDARLLEDTGMERTEAEALIERRRLHRVAELTGLRGRGS